MEHLILQQNQSQEMQSYDQAAATWSKLPMDMLLRCCVWRRRADASHIVAHVDNVERIFFIKTRL